MQMNEMPSIGTTLTYGEAIKAYDRFERTMLEKAYGAGLLPAVGLHDLLWQLESLAQKFGIVELADHLVGVTLGGSQSPSDFLRADHLGTHSCLLFPSRFKTSQIREVCFRTQHTSQNREVWRNFENCSQLREVLPFE